MKNIKPVPESISDRIKKLMDSINIKAYKVCKDTDIPEGTFSRSIKTPETWKLQHLEKLSEYFMVSLDYLVTGNISKIDEKLRQELFKANQELELLNKKLAAYESAANLINESKPKKIK